MLIPGLSSSRETWKVTADRLKDRNRLHLVQVAGFAGEPARANVGADGEVFVPVADAIDGYIAGLKAGKVLLAGHSLGGTLSLYLAQQHPEHLKKVLLVDALSFYGYAMGAQTVAQAKPIAEAMLKAPRTVGGADAQVRSMAVNKIDQDRIIGWGHLSDQDTVMRAMAEDIVLDLQPGLPAMTTPVTILHPDNIGLGLAPGLYHTYYQNAYRGQPAIKLVEIKGAQHFIMFDQPAAFAAAFDAWLAD
ncbi:alpha/beta hydrolase [soil metagenome]